MVDMDFQQIGRNLAEVFRRMTPEEVAAEQKRIEAGRRESVVANMLHEEAQARGSLYSESIKYE